MTRKPRFLRGPKKLPRFRSREEIVRFFETHSVAPYWEQMEEPDVVFELAPALARRIRERAKKRLQALRSAKRPIGRSRPKKER